MSTNKNVKDMINAYIKSNNQMKVNLWMCCTNVQSTVWISTTVAKQVNRVVASEEKPGRKKKNKISLWLNCLRRSTRHQHIDSAASCG